MNVFLNTIRNKDIVSRFNLNFCYLYQNDNNQNNLLQTTVKR